MSLKMYPVDICVPDSIRYVWMNDPYFARHTLIKDDDFTKRVLSEIDKAQRVSDNMFQSSRCEGALNRELLSTGAKTLLNISQHPDVCFNLNECGVNALRLLFTSVHTGNVIWTFSILDMLNEDITCDIEMEGQHFDSLKALNAFCGKLDIWECGVSICRGY